jgi:hypothetical protein
MAGKGQTGPLCGHTNPVNVDDGTMCRAESPQPGTTTSGIGSTFTWAADAISSEYASVTTTLQVKYNDLQRGIRDDFAGALCIYQACSLAEGFAPDEILNETGCQLKSLLSGLLPGLIQMVAIVGASTILGAGIGGLIGALAGGVGAAPGAVLGADIGFDIGMAVLTWLGVAFLAVAIAKGFVELLEAIRNGVEWAWQARNLKGPAQKQQVEKAAHELARSTGILMRLILQALLAYVLKKAAMSSTRGVVSAVKGIQTRGATAAAEASVAELVGKLRASKFGDGFGDWVEKNWKDLEKNPKLQPKEAPAPPQAPAAEEGGGAADQGGGGQKASDAADDSGGAAEEEKPDLSTNAKKGVFGEAKADAYMNSKGFKKLNGPDVQVGDAPRGQGIDGVYENMSPPPKYVIGEAKFGSSRLGKTLDGPQMGENWVDNRLDSAVGENRALDIMDEGYDRVLLKVDEAGNVTPKIITQDASGNIILSDPPPGSLFAPK